MNKVRLSPQLIGQSLDDTKPYILVTGATGLLGQYLLGDLISAGHQLAVVVRPTRKESASIRVERIMQHWESRLSRSLPRPVVIEGHVDQPGLGITADDQTWIKNNCESMIHNAAVLQFQGSPPDQEPWRTNFSGTQYALDVASSVGIRHFHYVSTAYVCGSREGTILESDFDCGQGFRNEYERSKFRAEELVRQTSQFETKTIYRPGVIAGDSNNGYTSTYHGLYVYLRLFAMFVPQQHRDEHGRLVTRVQIPMNGDENRNVVTVDWVSQVIKRIIETPSAYDNVYHLTPDVCITPKYLIDACFDFFDSCGVEFAGTGNHLPSADPDFAEKMFENVAIYQDYDHSDPTFDRTNLLQVAGDIPCPTIDSSMIHRYLKFGIEDKWGKSKPSAVDVPNFQSQLEMIRTAAGELNGELEAASSGESDGFSLRLVGSGGGDWRFCRNQDGQFEVTRGLGNGHGNHIEMAGADLQSGNGDIQFWKELLSSRLMAAK